MEKPNPIQYHGSAVRLGGLGMVERIGDFLISIGAMTADQVDEVLKAQALDKDGELRIFGEIAIEMGYIDDSALLKYMAHKAAAG
jgi:hypothetical protein